MMPENHPQLAHLALSYLDGDGGPAERCDACSEVGWHEAWETEFVQDGLVVVYSGGACKNNQSPRFRRAGCGGFWAKGHAYNFGLPLQGWSQTNIRAELQAVLTILETDPRSQLLSKEWRRSILRTNTNEPSLIRLILRAHRMLLPPLLNLLLNTPIQLPLCAFSLQSFKAYHLSIICT